MRDILERASARETTARVAAGAVARQLLAPLRHARCVATSSRIGGVAAGDRVACFEAIGAIAGRCAASLRGPRRSSSGWSRPSIEARDAGDTLGGAFEVIVRGVPVGLGSHVQWDRKLDGRLAQALMSIPAIKASASASAPRGRPARDPRCTTRSCSPAPGATGARLGVAADQPRRRPRRRRHQRRGAARHWLHEADLDADEAAPLGRSRDGRRNRPPRSSAATSARCRPPASSARRWSPGARRRVAREVRGRFHRGDRRQFEAARARLRAHFTSTGVAAS